MRIWIAGCATGEEAYSLAMLCAEHLERMTDAPKLQIFATDIDEAAITTAREGYYTINDAADVSPERLQRYFSYEGGNGYRIRREIRETILFAQHNFLKDPPFSRVDLVSCRNVLIYLNQTAQERVMETFHFALNPGGFLFLGNAESVDGAVDLYSITSRVNHIFQSRQVAGRKIVVPESVPQFRAGQVAKEVQQDTIRNGERISYGELHQRLIEAYASPSLVVNEAYDIVHISERAGRYLQMRGEPSQNLLKLLHEELRLELRSALYQATQSGVAVNIPSIRLRIDDHTETLHISVRPVLGEGNNAKGFILIVFEPVLTAPASEETPLIVTGGESLARQLEEEIFRLKAQLRASSEQHEFGAEELKASNEELQAMNEELRSAAEELETSKEELQSINEELRTVNQELKVKVEESSSTANNLHNLIKSTAIGTVFLDRSFRVMLYTPAALDIFNLIPTDQSRVLSDITNRLQEDHLIEDAQTVLDKLMPIEREMQLRDDRVFLARFTPYRTDEDRIQGVVITFVDITERKRNEYALRKSEARLQAVIENLPGGAVFIVDKDLRYILAEGQALRMVGQKPEDFIGKTVSAVPVGNSTQQEADYRQALAGESFVREHEEGEYIFSSRGIPLHDGTGEVYAVLAISYDITDRKRAEEAMRESAERLRILSDTVSHLIWTNKPTGEANYFNKRWYEYSGLTFEQSFGVGWQAIVHPDDALASEEHWQEALSRGEIFDTEYRLRSAGGTYRWFIGRNVPLRDKEGSITGWFGTATDIQELKEAEEALKVSRERLRITMESATDYAIITSDTANIINGWSAGAERIFGYTAAEAIGQPGALIFTPEDVAAGAPEEEVVTALAEGRAPDERWHMRRNGERFYMNGVMRPIYDGVLSGFVKVARDMTASQQAQEALRVTEERYRTAMQSANMGAWDWDIVTDEVVWNEQHFMLLGLAPKPQDVMHSIDFIRSVHPEDLERVKADLADAIASTGVYQSIFRIIRADNEEVRWMSGYGRAVNRDNKQATRIVGVMYDITAQKRLEQQKDEFISIASHELRTPVTSIKVYGEMLEERFAKVSDAHSAGIMRKLNTQVDQLTALIYALLDTTRITEGKLRLEKTTFNMNGLISDTVETMQSTAAGKHIALELEATARVYADKERIRQVLVNLIGNALKYSPDADRVVVRSTNDAQRLTVCVQDFGIGISPEARQQLFSRFFREKGARKFSGLGLGLFISASIIREHGGDIWVESQQGKGALFCFTLPLK